MKTPLQLLGMMLSGCSRKELADAMTDEQKEFLAERVAASVPHNRAQRRRMERTLKKKGKNR